MNTSLLPTKEIRTASRVILCILLSGLIAFSVAYLMANYLWFRIIIINGILLLLVYISFAPTRD